MLPVDDEEEDRGFFFHLLAVLASFIALDADFARLPEFRGFRRLGWVANGFCAVAFGLAAHSWTNMCGRNACEWRAPSTESTASCPGSALAILCTSCGSPRNTSSRGSRHVIFSGECLRGTTRLDDLAAGLQRMASRTEAFVAVSDGPGPVRRCPMTASGDSAHPRGGPAQVLHVGGLRRQGGLGGR